MDKQQIINLITSRVTISGDGCWLWPGNLSRSRYPRVKHQGVMTSPHRLAAVAWLDMPIESKLSVCHKCDVPRCCNPEHLFLGTHSENMVDKVNKNRCNIPIGELHWKAKLKAADVLEIVDAMLNGKMSQTDLAARYGVGKTTIVAIKRGENWSHLLCEETRKRLRDLDLTTYGEIDKQSKLRESDIIEIRKLYSNGVKQADLAKQFNVGSAQISRIITRKRWAHVIQR